LGEIKAGSKRGRKGTKFGSDGGGPLGRKLAEVDDFGSGTLAHGKNEGIDQSTT